MAPKYEIRQKVIIKQATSSTPTLRDCTVEPYMGQVGEVTNYYWMLPPSGEVFYVYTVRIGDGYKEIVVHEDEIVALKKSATKG